jgi:hypothetical protein
MQISVTDNPNNYPADTITSDGASIVKYNAFIRQHNWVPVADDNNQTTANEVVLNPPVGGSSNLQTAIQALIAVRGGGSRQVTQADLSVASIVAIVPAATGIYRDIEVYNNLGELINPDSAIVSTMGIAIGLGTYAPITGTYTILYRVEQI